MMQMVSHFEECSSQPRPMPPRNTALRQTTGRHEPQERVAMRAIDVEKIEVADAFARFAEACVQHDAR